MSTTSSATHRSQREHDIMRAATELFALQGFHNTSTRKIADAAQVSEGAVFHYFKTKAHLLQAILDDFYQHTLTDHIEEQLNSVMNTSQRLDVMAQHHAKALAADNALMMRLIQVYLSSSPEAINHAKTSHLHDLNRRYTRVFDRIIREGIARGEIDANIALDAIRDLFFGGIEYGLRTVLIREKAKELPQYIDRVLMPVKQFILSRQANNSTGAGNDDLQRAVARLEAVSESLEALTDR